MNILISPLNWGIGHATRLVPIIKELKKKHKITLAADGKSFFFLKKEFSDINIIKAPKLKIKYSFFRFFMPVKILLIFPKLISFYFKNQKWIKKHIKNRDIDVIISDNRFGFFSKKIKSIFITHQIYIEAKNKILKKIIFIVNRLNIQKYNECWIPDDKNLKISGNLSNSAKIKIPCKRIGILSRFNDEKIRNKQKKYNFVVIISGPEPQRSIFQKKIINILTKIDAKTLILTGELSKKHYKKNKNIIIKTHLTTSELQKIIISAEIIIARSGYSTIMDLLKLKKTAILVPTPAQTEQEYLANYLHCKKMFFSVEQNKIDKKTLNTFKLKQDKLQKNILKALESGYGTKNFNKLL